MNEQSLYRRIFASEAITAPTLWRAFASYGVWAVCFTVLYTGHALGCTWILTSGRSGLTVSPAAVTSILIGVWLFFVVAQLMLAVRSAIRAKAVRPQAPGRTRQFMSSLTVIADASALGVTLITGLPIILTKACI